MKSIVWVFTLLFITSLTGVLLAGSGTRSHTVDGEFYTVSWHLKSGAAPKAILVTVSPKPGLHSNLEYPWKLTVQSFEGLETTQTVYTKADAVTFAANEVVFSIPVSRIQPKASLTAEIKLSMCDDTQCFMKKVPLSIRL